MRKRALFAGCVLTCLILVAPIFSQEGHPMTGTWGGDWGPNATTRNHLTFVLNWDGKAITGTINPGPDSIKLSGVILDVTNWTVRFEADTKDAAGKPVHISAEGKLEDISSYHRKITGSWTQGTTKGDFKLTRD